MTVMKKHTADWVWPGAVIGLILLGMTMTFGILYASRVDGGPEVIPDYYDRAVVWDDMAAERAASEALGWTASIERPDEGQLRLTVRNADGEPISGVHGTVTLMRPHRAAAVEVIPFRVDASNSAVDIPVTAHGSGLWDVHIEARRGKDRYVDIFRREWRLP